MKLLQERFFLVHFCQGRLLQKQKNVRHRINFVHCAAFWTLNKMLGNVFVTGGLGFIGTQENRAA